MNLFFSSRVKSIEPSIQLAKHISTCLKIWVNKVKESSQHIPYEVIMSALYNLMQRLSEDMVTRLQSWHDWQIRSNRRGSEIPNVADTRWRLPEDIVELQKGWKVLTPIVTAVQNIFNALPNPAPGDDAFSLKEM